MNLPFKIFCLMTSGLPLSQAACDALFRTANQMVKGQKRSKKLISDDVEGQVTTDFQRANMSHISGLVFEAAVATEKGQTTVKFIVRDGDLEGIENAQWDNLRELAEKYRKRPPRLPSPSNN